MRRLLAITAALGILGAVSACGKDAPAPPVSSAPPALAPSEDAEAETDAPDSAQEEAAAAADTDDLLTGTWTYSFDEEAEVMFRMDGAGGLEVYRNISDMIGFAEKDGAQVLLWRIDPPAQMPLTQTSGRFTAVQDETLYLDMTSLSDGETDLIGDFGLSDCLLTQTFGAMDDVAYRLHIEENATWMVALGSYLAQDGSLTMICGDEVLVQPYTLEGDDKLVLTDEDGMETVMVRR